MIKEKSCGAVVYKIVNNQYYFLIEKMKRGHFSIPKGHVEKGESELETAYREIKEETNLDVIIDSSFREVSTYSPYENCIKDVVFFVANIVSDKVINQECEVSDIFFYPFDKAYKILTHQSDKEVLLKAYLYLLVNNSKKIIIIGSPGSGKSYLSPYVANKTKIKLHHLDNMYWYGNWNHISTQELYDKVEEVMKDDKWIIDGHFASTIEQRISNADTIIYFNLPGITCVNGVKNRIKNHPIRDDMPSTCIETELDPEFETCMLNFRKNNNHKLQKLFKQYPSNLLTITSKKMLHTIVKYLKDGE